MKGGGVRRPAHAGTGLGVLLLLFLLLVSLLLIVFVVLQVGDLASLQALEVGVLVPLELVPAPEAAAAGELVVFLAVVGQLECLGLIDVVGPALSLVDFVLFVLFVLVAVLVLVVLLVPVFLLVLVFLAFLLDVLLLVVAFFVALLFDVFLFDDFLLITLFFAFLLVVLLVLGLWDLTRNRDTMGTKTPVARFMNV